VRAESCRNNNSSHSSQHERNRRVKEVPISRESLISKCTKHCRFYERTSYCGKSLLCIHCLEGIHPVFVSIRDRAFYLRNLEFWMQAWVVECWSDKRQIPLHSLLNIPPVAMVLSIETLIYTASSINCAPSPKYRTHDLPLKDSRFLFQVPRLRRPVKLGEAAPC
jgi:hypothetical protein